MNKPDISVIIPTYRERENLAVLLPALQCKLSESGIRGELLVVDDDSRDGTDALSASLSDSCPHQLIVRTSERGLATAVIRGIQESRADVVVVMDADLSHPPEIVPELFHAVDKSQSSMAVGSRYMRGGSIDSSWSLRRRIVSRTASLMARPLTGVKDPMSGFFAFRRSAMPGIDQLNPTGFKIGLELLVKGQMTDVCEVPIHFTDRIKGESKFDFGQALQYLRHVSRLYAWQLKRGLRC